MRFDVTFRELDKKLDVDFCTRNEQIKVDFEHLQVVSDNVGVDYYKGDYTVTPKVEKQELATRQKFLTENVKIKEIPFFEVSNLEGGQTVFIGKELLNMSINKVVYGGKTLIDLTGDTVTADKLLSGITAHGKDGELVTGTCTFDVDSNDATVAVAEILKGKTAYARGTKLVGTMPNNGAVTGSIKTLTDSYVIAQGYHDGSGKFGIDATEKKKLTANNIREGVTILGVKGTMSGSEGVKAQAKTVTPSSVPQTIMPDAGYTHLSQVTVEKIPYVESENSAGGTTVTIG